MYNYENKYARERIYSPNSVRLVFYPSRKKKQPKTTGQHNAPWFDRQCQAEKDAMMKIAKNIKRDPDNTKFRENLYLLC